MQKKPPEKYWQKLVDCYFGFYKMHHRDNDGYPLSPNWSGPVVGMESKNLKLIIERIRTIAEEKNIEWSEKFAVDSLHLFLEKAWWNFQWMQKSFMCTTLNKFKDQIIVSENNSRIVNQLVELWYKELPNYTRSDEMDRKGAEIIFGFFKQQYIAANLVITEKSILSSWLTVINQVKTEEFWDNKSLRSVANNMQEFVNKIKTKNGANKNFTREGVASEIARRYSE